MAYFCTNTLEETQPRHKVCKHEPGTFLHELKMDESSLGPKLSCKPSKKERKGWKEKGGEGKREKEGKGRGNGGSLLIFTHPGRRTPPMLLMLDLRLMGQYFHY